MGLLFIRRCCSSRFTRLLSSSRSFSGGLGLGSGAAADSQSGKDADTSLIPAADRKDSIILSGYDAWWRIWQQQRSAFPAVGVQDILGFIGDEQEQPMVVLDANIGAVFARLQLDKKSTSPDRQVFLSMLNQLMQRQRLSAPPKLMHRYGVAVNRTVKVCIPAAPLDEEKRMRIGRVAQEMMQWIVEDQFELPRDASKSMDFLVTLLQCAYLYKSTILLTNNKDYYFVLKAAKALQSSMHGSYPEFADTIDLGSIRIVFVQEQLKLNVYQVVRV